MTYLEYIKEELQKSMNSLVEAMTNIQRLIDQQAKTGEGVKDNDRS